MKPLPVAPSDLTGQDRDIWAWVGCRHECAELWWLSSDADRRDAELMRRIARRLASVKAVGGPPRVVELVCIAPVFWPPVGIWAVDITYCA